MAETPKKIVLNGDPLRKEGIASEQILPGLLLDYGEDGTLIRHASEQGNAAPMFAVEQDFIGGGIDKVYNIGDQVQYVVARPGDEIYAVLSPGEEVKKGDFLSSGGAGLLVKHKSPELDDSGVSEIALRAIVARALEDLDLSDAGDEVARIMVEVV